MCKRFKGILCVGLFYIVITCFSIKLNAQTFGLSLNGGIVASQIDGDESAGYNKPGPFIGLNGIVHLKPKLDLEIGISYVFRGSQSELFQDNSIPQLKISLQYIDVPLTIHYKDWLVQETNFYHMDFYAGVYYGRLFSASAENSGFDDVTDNFKKNEIGIILGGGYSFDPHNSIGVKWCRGLNYLYSPDKNIVNARSLINRFLQFYYQYKF
jgi:hypothetical protein